MTLQMLFSPCKSIRVFSVLAIVFVVVSAFLVSCKGSMSIDPPTDAEAVAATIAELTFASIQNLNFASYEILTDLALPVSDENGTQIAWESSNTTVLSGTGAVTRDASQSKNVTLTATVTKGSACDTKTFSLTIYPIVDNPDWVSLGAATAPDSTFSLSGAVGAPVENIEGQLFLGSDVGYGRSPGYLAQVGFGPLDSDPTTEEWSWSPAMYSQDYGSNDVYKGSVTVNNAGTYGLAYRFSADGNTWVYGDANGTPFEISSEGVLTITN